MINKAPLTVWPQDISKWTPAMRDEMQGLLDSTLLPNDHLEAGLALCNTGTVVLARHGFKVG